MLCRKEEQERIYTYIKNGLATNGNYNLFHIVGATGTGKTSCVENVLNILEYELKEAIDKGNKITPFRKLFLNGINYLNTQIFKIYTNVFLKTKIKITFKI